MTSGDYLSNLQVILPLLLKIMGDPPIGVQTDFLEYAPIGPAGPTRPPRGASEHFSSPIWPLGWFCMYGGCPQRQP